MVRLALRQSLNGVSGWKAVSWTLFCSHFHLAVRRERERERCVCVCWDQRWGLCVCGSEQPRQQILDSAVRLTVSPSVSLPRCLSPPLSVFQSDCLPPKSGRACIYFSGTSTAASALFSALCLNEVYREEVLRVWGRSLECKCFIVTRERELFFVYQVFTHSGLAVHSTDRGQQWLCWA